MASRPSNAARIVRVAQRAGRLPIAGPVPPARDVEKNTGSIWSKSRSSSIRCTSTDPTMPRQPTIPTRIVRFPIRVIAVASNSLWVRLQPDALSSKAEALPASAGHPRFRSFSAATTASPIARVPIVALARPARCRRCAGPAPAPRAPRASMRSATSARANVWRNIIATDRIVASGLALSWPAMSGAEPWIGS